MNINATNLRRRLLPVLVAGCFGTAAANPLGPQVVSGQASFLNQGNVLSVTNTPGAIINWQSFSINPGELTRFIQQNADSAVLNRITGQDPSQILGALQSNGRVFLVNPNGILFGQGAQVDVNGLVASTLNISNDDFLNGKLLFQAGGKAGKLSNQGAITTPAGGQVILIAPNVENSGIITSPKGDVMLAAGHTVQLVDTLNPELRVVLSAPEHEALNLGQVIAHGGKTGIYGALVRQRGIVNADSAVVGENGRVILKASRDTLLEAGSRTSARGAGKGGEIQVLGERVGLTDDAQVDASGRQGGGMVLVGGDYQGKNADVQNAKRTYVGKDAQIKADALDQGDGGRVIVWADETTRAHGTFSARGGQDGGNGGFIETSGKQALETGGIRVNAGAPKGAMGSWLLDPSDITIVHGSSSALTAGMFDPASLDGSIGDTEINAALNAGTSVTIQTTAGTGGAGDITFDGDVDIVNNSGGSRSLTLNAGRKIHMSAGASIAGTSGNPLTTQFSATGEVILGNGAHIQTFGGNVTLNGTGTGIAGLTTGVELNGATIDAGSGTVSITGIGYVSGGKGVNLQHSMVEANGGITISGTGRGTGDSLHAVQVEGVGLSGYSLKSSGVMAVTGTTNASGNVNVGVLVTEGAHIVGTGSGNVTLTGRGGTSGANNHGVLINSSSVASVVVTDNGNITLQGTAGNVDPTAMGVGIYGSGSYIEALGTGSVSITALTPSAAGQGNDFVLDSNSYTGIHTNAGNISIRADNMRLDSGVVDAGTGQVSLRPHHDTTAIKLGAPDNNGVLGLTQAELSAIGTNSTLKIGSSTLSGDIDVVDAIDLRWGTGLASSVPHGTLRLETSTGDITISNALRVPGALSLVSGAGAISQSTSAGMVLEAPDGINAMGASVALNGDNLTGIIAGKTTGGNFEFKSVEQLTVHTVDGQAGIDAAGGMVMLHGADWLGVDQDSSAPIKAAGGLGVKSAGPVLLTNANNNFAKFAAKVSGETEWVEVYSSAALNVGGPIMVTGNELTGIATLGGDVSVASGGALTISEKITVGTGSVKLQADTLTLGNTIEAASARIQPNSDGKSITIGSSTCAESGCLLVTNLHHIDAPEISIGSDYAPEGGNIFVASIAAAGGTGIDQLHANTTSIGLITARGVSQGGAIEVRDLAILAGDETHSVNLPAANKVANLAIETLGAPVTFANARPEGLTVSYLTGGSYQNGTDYSAYGIYTHGGDINLSTTAGDLILDHDVDASAVMYSTESITSGLAGSSGDITLTSAGALTSPSGGVYGSSLVATATDGINLFTEVLTLSALNSGASSDINIVNYTPLTLHDVKQTALSSDGNITISNYYGMNLAAGKTVSTDKGGITLSADHALNVAGTISTAGTLPGEGNILLQANPSHSSSGTDVLTISGSVSTSAGHILLEAGDAISITGTVSTISGLVTQHANLNGMSGGGGSSGGGGGGVQPPTLDQCVANPALSGCGGVLPTVDACITNPATPGCTVVLPTVDACVTDPAKPGCTAVLPTLDACVITPTKPGCSAVLPSMDTCTANPTQTGCAVVLPPLSSCTANPTQSGCSVVLPSLTSCTANPSQTGCSVVLPSLTSCTANPAQPGCTAVLPPLSSCTSNPAQAGCSAVLPTVDACTANPQQTGCTAVLPTLSACTITPSQPGCSAVLPSMSSCTSTPTLPGCTAVLPTLAQCSATPSLDGCAAVLPAVNKCVTNPALPECQTVLPPPAGGTDGTPAPTPARTISDSVADTANTVVATTAKAQAATTRQAGGSGSGGGSGEQAPNKGEERKDEKKTTSTAEDSGAKKNEPATKMYCN